jgi:hypothetical protein
MSSSAKEKRISVGKPAGQPYQARRSRRNENRKANPKICGCVSRMTVPLQIRFNETIV